MNSERINIANGSLLLGSHPFNFYTTIPLQLKMKELSKESRLNLALQALQKDSKLSLRAASKVYSISYTTLHSRRHGRCARTDISANSRKLTNLEEEVLLQYILDLDAKSFPP